VKPTIDLYPFQKEGIQFLIDNAGGMLWDEPGLGKTTQAIVAARELTDEHEPILVVCPNALKSWWRREIKKIFPSDASKIAVAGVGGRFKTDISRMKWVIIHYTGLRMRRKSLPAILWGAVVLDECHYIKNRKAQRTAAVLAVTFYGGLWSWMSVITLRTGRHNERQQFWPLLRHTPRG